MQEEQQRWRRNFSQIRTSVAAELRMLILPRLAFLPSWTPRAMRRAVHIGAWVCVPPAAMNTGYELMRYQLASETIAVARGDGLRTLCWIIFASLMMAPDVPVFVRWIALAGAGLVGLQTAVGLAWETTRVARTQALIVRVVGQQALNVGMRDMIATPREVLDDEAAPRGR